MMHPLFCEVPGRWQCRTSDSPKISLLVRTRVLPRPLEIRRITTVVPQRDRSPASFGSHRHGNGLRSNREIVGRSRLIQNDSVLPLGLAEPSTGRLDVRQTACARRSLAGMIGGGTWEGAPMPGMRRRDFVALLGGAAAAWPLAAHGQQAERMRRIGVLMGVASDEPESQARIAAFLQGLREMGWIDGRNVWIDTLWSAGDAARLRRDAA